MMIRFHVYCRRVKLAFKPDSFVAIGLFVTLAQMSGLPLCQVSADELPRPQLHAESKMNSIEHHGELNSQFEKALDQVNEILPARITSGLEQSVTGYIKPFIPEIKTVGEAMEFLTKIQLKPKQDKWDSGVVFTLAYVDYERLKSNNRRRFRKGDRLVLSFTSRDTAPDGIISNFQSSVLNPSLF